jgi:lactoylglutathione lyase
MGDFTLYFLAFDHDGSYASMTQEQKDKARFAREGKQSPVMGHYYAF